MRFRLSVALLAVLFAASPAVPQAPLPAPGFHHLHLNSIDPDAAIAFYIAAVPEHVEDDLGRHAGARVAEQRARAVQPRGDGAGDRSGRTAIWHFGWHVTDVRQNLQTYQGRPEVTLLPLYTGDDGGSVFVSSDTWPGTGGVLGLTQGADRRSQGAAACSRTRGARLRVHGRPRRRARGICGQHPAERFNHVHFYQEDPFCAQLWYQQHLNAPRCRARNAPAAMTEADCKVARGPDRTWPALDARRHVPHADGRRRVRRRGVELVHAPERRRRSSATRGQL